jgi:uncharacterized protein (UPF0335 family)
MGKKNEKPMMNVAELQPDELGALKAVVLEFVQKVESIDNEIELLKTDRKDLFEEYSERIDTKTLIQVLRVLKIESGVAYKDTYDLMREALGDKTQ